MSGFGKKHCGNLRKPVDKDNDKYQRQRQR